MVDEQTAGPPVGDDEWRIFAPQTAPTELPAEAPTTEAIQTVQRIVWTRIILVTVSAVFGLVLLGWIAGSISHSFATPPAVRAYDELIATPGTVQLTGGTDGVSATVVYEEGTSETVLQVTGLPELESDEQFVAWYMIDGNAIEAERFTPTSGDTATIFLKSARPDGAGLTITIERAGSVSQPTAEPVVSIDPPQ